MNFYEFILLLFAIVSTKNIKNDLDYIDRINLRDTIKKFGLSYNKIMVIDSGFNLYPVGIGIPFGSQVIDINMSKTSKHSYNNRFWYYNSGAMIAYNYHTILLLARIIISITVILFYIYIGVNDKYRLLSLTIYFILSTLAIKKLKTSLTLFIDNKVFNQCEGSDINTALRTLKNVQSDCIEYRLTSPLGKIIFDNKGNERLGVSITSRIDNAKKWLSVKTV